MFATVTDAGGRLVSDLKQTDFQIFDDGKRQPITLFSAEIQPVTVVVMLDRSGSLAQESDWVREAAGEFIKRLLPADRARIGNFSNEIRISPPSFTNDHAALTRVLRDDLQSVGPSPVWTAVDRSITALLPERGRRVVLLFSDGVDAPMRSQVKTDVKDVMYRAQYDEIMVYAIGVPTQQVSTQSTIHADRSGRLTPTTVYTSKRGKPDPNLRLLAGESGGGYFFELDPHGEPVDPLREGRRRTASSVLDRLRGRSARPQGAQIGGQGAAFGPDRAGTKELRRRSPEVGTGYTRTNSAATTTASSNRPVAISAVLGEIPVRSSFKTTPHNVRLHFPHPAPLVLLTYTCGERLVLHQPASWSIRDNFFTILHMSMNRRHFLELTAVGGGALAASCSVTSSGDGGLGAVSVGVDVPAAPLPPAIAALKPMTAGVVPISDDERRARIAKAQKLMAEQKLDAIFMEGTTSMFYFANMRWGQSERTFGLVIPAEGEVAYVCPGFEEDRARELITFGKEVRVWQEEESQY